MNTKTLDGERRESARRDMLAEERLAASVAVAVPFPGAVERRAERRPRRGRAWFLHRVLLVADLIGLSAAFFLAQIVFEARGATPDAVSPWLEAMVFALTLPLWVLIAQLSGLYGRDGQRADHSTVDDFAGIFAVITIGAWLFWAFASLTRLVRPDAPRMFAFWLMAIAFVASTRALARKWARRSPLYMQNAIIVGAGDVGQLIARKLEKHPESAIRLVGFVDEQPRATLGDLNDVQLLGTLEALPSLAETLEIDRVIIAYSLESHEKLLQLIHELKTISVQIDLVPRLFEAVGPRVEMHTVEALPLIGLPPVRLTPSDRLVKRAIDIVLASVALVLTAAATAPISRCASDATRPAPSSFARLGWARTSKEFTALKFRSMREDADDTAHRAYIEGSLSWRTPAGENGLYKPDFKHLVTPVGRKLRTPRASTSFLS